ncbi:MAG: hypothetical protein ACHRHE_20730 [Tepidisphaerales bacterium]
MFNIVVGMVWQTTLVTAPIYLVIQHWMQLSVSLGGVRGDLDHPQVHLV